MLGLVLAVASWLVEDPVVDVDARRVTLVGVDDSVTNVVLVETSRGAVVGRGTRDSLQTLRRHVVHSCHLLVQ